MKTTFSRVLCMALILCLLASALLACDTGKSNNSDNYTTETVSQLSTCHVYVINGTQTDLQEVTFYSYDDFGRCTVQDGPTKRISHTYDEQGNLTVTHSDALKDSQVIASTETRMTYDKAGNAITRDHYRITDGTETLTGSYTLTYDGQNRLLEEKSADVIFRYVYTENNGYTLTETDAKTGELLTTITVVKDAKGNTTSETTESRETGNTESYTAVYDEAGNVLSKVYFLNGAELDSFLYEYEQNGNELRLSRVTTKRDGVEIQHADYIYNTTDAGYSKVVEVRTPDDTLTQYTIYQYVTKQIKVKSRQ